MDLLRLWWGITKKLMDKSVKDGKPWNYGLMQYRTTPISLTLLSPLEMLTGRRPHSTLPQLPSTIGKNMWKPPRSMRNCLGGNPTLPQGTKWNWTLDNLSLSRKWVEMFGKLPLLTNQQLSLIHIGWDFQTISYWEGPGKWSNPGLNLLILSYRLKHSHGTLKENLAHVLQTPSTRWKWSQCCLLHQWKVWHHQQPKIGTAKLGCQLILSFPQRYPSLLCKWNHTKYFNTKAFHPFQKRCSTSQIYTIKEITVLEYSGNFHFICAGLLSAV